MTKTELVQSLEKKLPFFTHSDITETVDALSELMAYSLLSNRRIEIRGFGSFFVNHFEARSVKNPRTGQVLSNKKYSATVRFKPAATLRESIMDLKA